MTKFEKKRKRIFDIIQLGNKTDVPSTIFDIFISTLIIVSISVTFLQTFEELEALRPILSIIEVFTIVVFLIEYILRLWTAKYLYENTNSFVAMWKYVFSFYGLVDLLTIASYFMPLFTNGVVALRMLRVVRIMRLFKLNSTYDAFNVITDVLKDKKDQLISSCFMIVILLLASSMCMYSLEHEAQPDNFQNAFSGIWWSVSTLLTVGYGDIYPITIGGRIMAIIISFLGVGMVAIPTGIISAGFVEYFSRVKAGMGLKKNSDFILIDVNEGHMYVDKKIGDINLPGGLYIAAVLRSDYTHTPSDDFVIKQYDTILLASTSSKKIYSNVEEITLDANHPWIDSRIMDLDISRKLFIIMIKRRNKIIKPEASTRLAQNDVLIMLDSRVAKK